MKKATGVLWAALLAGAASAGEITAEQAQTAVKNWTGVAASRALAPRMGLTPKAKILTCSSPDGTPLFHVVPLDGGGFIVTSADDGVEPIVAFSDSGSFCTNADNSLWVLLNHDMAARTAALKKGAKAAVTFKKHGAWSELLSGASKLQTATKSVASVSDLRVAPLLSTEWGQTTANGYEDSGNLYNYYTPNHYACGCVATVGAQMMRYYQYPIAAVTSETYACSVDRAVGNKLVAQTVRLTMQGGVYDWANMPYVCQNGVTDTQRNAIAKLTSDIGIACLMEYGEYGSGAGMYMLAVRMEDRFQYQQAKTYCQDTGTLGQDELHHGILANLDAKLPVGLGIAADDGGHAVVADGYGYSGGTLYVHVNIGFDGEADAWYNLPSIAFTLSGSRYDFNIVDTLVYNVMPEQAGEILSGRVLSHKGAVSANTLITVKGNSQTFTATTDGNGIYSVVVPHAGVYAVSATNLTEEGTATATVYDSVSTETTEDGYFNRGTGSVGNSWGNDITLTLIVGAPTNVTASLATSSQGVDLVWTPGKKAITYQIWRGRFGDFSSAVCIASNVTATAYSDTDVEAGLTFSYWIVSVDAYGNEGEPSAMVTGMRAYAAGEEPYVETPRNDTQFATKGTFDGYVYGTRTVGTQTVAAVLGTVTFKLTGTQGKATAKVTTLGAKLSFSSKRWTSIDSEGSCIVTMAAKNGSVLTVYVRQNRIWGTLQGGTVEGVLTLDGARNPFVERGNANANALGSYRGVWTAGLASSSVDGGTPASLPYGISAMSVSVGPKGKTRVTCVLADGQKGSATCQLVFLNAANGCTACVPVFMQLYTGKRGCLGVLLWLDSASGRIVVDTGKGWGAWWYNSNNGGFKAALGVEGARLAGVTGSAFTLGDTNNVPLYNGIDSPLESLLPISVPVGTAGSWSTPKAEKVAKDGTAPAGAVNPAALKLKYTSSSGFFKGSFYVYYLSSGKMKKAKAAVNGISANGSGVGAATILDTSPAVKSMKIKRSMGVTVR